MIETILLCATLGLGAVDIHQTNRCAQLPNCRELNPIMRPVAGNVPGMIAVKAGTTFVPSYFNWKSREKDRKWARIGLGIVVGIQTFTVIHNQKQGRR